MKVELIDVTSDPENLIAESARVCYKSSAKKKSDNTQLVERLRDMGHMSTFEHAKASFRISGISRACSHQLVRHRHVSFSMMSQRYVEEKEFGYVTPPEIKKSAKAKKTFTDQMNSAQKAYDTLIKHGIKKEDARFVLPNATETELVLTANFRTLREFIQLRSTPQAQWEIREVAARMLKLLKEEAPAAFSDL